MTLVSPCCGKPVRIVYENVFDSSSANADSAMHKSYACTKCGKPCDPVHESEYHVRFVDKLRDEWDDPVSPASVPGSTIASTCDSATSAGDPVEKNPLGFDEQRMIAGEESVKAGRTRPLAEVLGELRDPVEKKEPDEHPA